MTRQEALLLAGVLALREQSIAEGARELGLERQTLMSRAARAGVRLGVAVRAWRIVLTEMVRGRAAVSRTAAGRSCNWSSASAYCRARRTVRRWPEWEWVAELVVGIGGGNAPPAAGEVRESAIMMLYQAVQAGLRGPALHR